MKIAILKNQISARLREAPAFQAGIAFQTACALVCIYQFLAGHYFKFTLGLIFNITNLVALYLMHRHRQRKRKTDRAARRVLVQVYRQF
jgi:hypothetical protein